MAWEWGQEETIFGLWSRMSILRIDDCDMQQILCWYRAQFTGD